LPLERAAFYPALVFQPPEPESAPRRHRSRQREQMLAWLRSTDCHPSASQIRDALAGESPGISLATVYRNLEVLLEEGKLREVACEGGPARYDGNLEPHHHFTCERCERIVDVDLAPPRSWTRRLADVSGLHATRVSVSFYGVCDACETEPGTASADEGT
jgi:Fe2+ or Zn2+ uptake regulation protein